MTSGEVEILIKQGEGYNVEFKQSVPSKASDLAEEICAFANAAGGTLLIGVNDRGQVVGATMDNTAKSRLQNILNSIEPRFNVDVTEVTIEGKNVICLECQSGKEKPYTVSGSIIVRNGPNSEKITSVQKMRDFFQQADRIFFDEVLCKQFDYSKDFDNGLFRSFLEAAGISHAALSEANLLDNLKLVEDGLVFKNGAVLLFSKDPQKFFEQAVTRCVLFKGTNKTHILDDKLFGGDLINQYKSALSYLRQKLNLNYIIEGGGPRKEVLEIPEEVFREALVNALCHRDYYEKGAVIMVEIYDDRVEISNPGGLVQSISKQEFGTRSFSRNSLVFGLFQRMELVEKIGSGINRMKDAMQKADLPEPVFSLDGIFTARFFRPVDFDSWIASIKGRINERQHYILQRLNSHPGTTNKAMAELIHTSTRTVERYILGLRELGLLERVGTDKDGYYKIIKLRL